MLDFVRTGQILSIGDNIRIEPGPARIEAMATAELLGPATADHYFAPRDATPAEIEDPNVNTVGGKVVAIDALGQPIEIGKPLTYLDWVGFAVGAPVYCLYHREACTPEEMAIRCPRDSQGKLTGEPPTDTSIWREVAFFPTEDEAISAALTALEG